MPIRTIILALAGLLLAAIAWAAYSANFFESFGRIIADPWGIVTLIDLYLGFILISVVVHAVERGRLIAWLVIAPTFFLGNVVTALWLVWRAPRILAMVRLQAEAA
jgi:hypothetical protein